MARLLFCTRCATAYESIAGDVPPACPSCARNTVWSTMAPVATVEPLKPYELTRRDRTFLRALYISPDE